MAVLFFLVGFEVKREGLEGELSDPPQVVLPAVAAAGGMAVPAAINAAINAGNPVALAGWAILAATDIAFALGVLSLLGNRVPTGLKVLLLTLAILDDLGAIVITAIFYASNLAPLSLGVARPRCSSCSRSTAGVWRGWRPISSSGWCCGCRC